MKPILVGSRGLRKLFPYLRIKFDADLDLWFDESCEAKNKQKSDDFCSIPSKIYKMISAEGIHTDEWIIPSPSHLLTIKLAHMGWDIFWDKHFKDVCKIKLTFRVEPNLSLFRELKSFWKVKHGNKDFLSLYKNKKDFFTDNVTYVMDHDLLHEYVAGDKNPLYKACLSENEQVAIDRAKFKQFEPEKKIQLFQEEMTVIAIERWLINPSLYNKFSRREAYHLSLRKTIVSLTKGWATDFILLNLEKFAATPHYLFNNAEKMIELHEKKTMANLSEEQTMNVISMIIEKFNKTNLLKEHGYCDSSLCKDPSYKDDLSRFIFTVLSNHTATGFRVILKKDSIEADLLEEPFYTEQELTLIIELDGRYYKMSNIFCQPNYEINFNNTIYSEVIPVQKTITVYR